MEHSARLSRQHGHLLYSALQLHGACAVSGLGYTVYSL